jgi:hypothetical protein
VENIYGIVNECLSDMTTDMRWKRLTLIYTREAIDVY